MTVEYKELTVENIAGVMVLGLEMHEEALPKKYPVDIEYAAQRCYESVILSEHAFGAIAMDGEEPVGMLMGQLAHYDWAPVMFAYNLIWAKEKGAVHVAIGLASGVRTKKTGKALSRAGYRHMGGNFIKEI
jgi:hypothetical protein